jgi:hypothetical protein
MMGTEFAALFGLASLTSAFAVVAFVLAAWMAWRIVDKAGLPGWTGLGAVLLTLTAIGTIVPLVLLWVFAFMRWPRDEAPAAALSGPGMAPAAPAPVPSLAAPARVLPDRRGWQLAGKLADGTALQLGFDDSASTWLLTGAPVAQPTELSVPDTSVGHPHARLMVAGTRLGLADLGRASGTFIDGARLLPEHGARDVTAIRRIRLGNVELTLSRNA